MNEWLNRTEMVLGKENIKKLFQSTVCIFGIGGVGSFVVEGLARSGIGSFILVDGDIIDVTNINRQIHATLNTIGKNKVDVMKERILSINSDAKVKEIKEFVHKNIEELFDNNSDYIIDAIDDIPAKIEIICESVKRNKPIISSMGTGNKLDPGKFKIDNIYSTKYDPLSKKVRKELRKKGIKKLKVLYSDEKPIYNNSVPGSVSWVPSSAGLMIAGEVVKDIIWGV